MKFLLLLLAYGKTKKLKYISAEIEVYFSKHNTPFTRRTTAVNNKILYVSENTYRIKTRRRPITVIYYGLRQTFTGPETYYFVNYSAAAVPDRVHIIIINPTGSQTVASGSGCVSAGRGAYEGVLYGIRIYYRAAQLIFFDVIRLPRVVLKSGRKTE